MNGLLKLHTDSPIALRYPLKELVYMALISDMRVEDEDDTRYAVFNHDGTDVYDYFEDWDSEEVEKVLSELADEGRVFFSEDGDTIYVGEIRGRRFFPFEQKTSLYERAVEQLNKALSAYGSSKSAKDKSRARFIRERIDEFPDIDKMSPGNFTDLHGYLYEIATGGEIYTIRNKTEYYQTNNMLKAYDRNTVFALIVEGTLNYNKYRSKGVPSITNVAYIKDDVMRSLTTGDGSKDYMRDTRTAVSESSDF